MEKNVSEVQEPTSSKEIERIDALNERSWALRFQNARQALRCAQEAQGLAETAGYLKGEAYSLLNQGVAHWILAEFGEAKTLLMEASKKMAQLGDELGEAKAINWLGNAYERLKNEIEALNCHLRALELREKNGDREGVGISLNNIGNLYMRLEDYPTALSYYFNALKIRQEISDEEGEAATLTNIGIIHYYWGKFAEARDYALRGVEGFRRSKNLQGEANAINNLGLALERLGEEDEAIRCYNEALRIHSELGDKQGEANALNNLGLLFAKNGSRRRDALECYQKSLRLSQQTGDKLFETETLLNIGMFFKQENRDEEAIEWLLKARELATEIRSKKYLAEACKSLAELYEARGDIERAFDLFKTFQQAHAQALEERTEERLHALIARNEVQKARQEAEIYRLKNIELAKANEMLAEANAALKEANQLKSEFLAIAAHDLKNPLAAILEFAQNILATSDRRQQERMVALIGEFTERMLSIIRQVLEMSEIESGNIALNRRKVDVGQLAMLMVASYEHRAAKKSLQICEDIEDGAIAYVDEDRLREILDNLLSNAIKYSYPEKTIRVRVRALEKGEKICEPVVQIAVQDEGQGFTEEDKAKLFRRFQRLSAKPTGGESSTGLGLSIVKQLVELHHGAIWATSDGRDKGATFVIELPVEES
ncbi:MAG: tetratricopeptide repeat-containing sensor histidine kinase [Chloroherpetonaceae bacterium]|nr:tetratricopeptide repeat-containing sensor histidine kinase [Chloroherpetonaceae bacterium]MDW8437178.1 tetratricopeptide repeat-containing sensor histidine kinase [Chloroherpetonaceae bacterium]